MGRGGRALLVAILVSCVPAPAASAISIDVVGPEETVYDYASQHCFRFDQPDGQVHPFRDASGRVQVWLPGANTRMLGPDLDNLIHDCKKVLVPNLNPDPSHYDDRNGWLIAPYTTDGQTVHALVHSEYHGIRHAGWCPGEPFIKCRYNSATLARSTDGGESFQLEPAAGAAALVAALPYRYVPGDGRYGYFAPGNIVERNGWYYSTLMASSAYRAQRAGICVMRTRDPTDPKSWRAWDGNDYSVRFIDPYRESPEPVHRHVCEPVSYEQIQVMNRSLTWNTFLEKWVITGSSTKYDPARGEHVNGFYFSVSDDLINWSERKLILEDVTGATFVCGGTPPRAYPSIIDPSSTDRTFSTVGRTAYLYLSESVIENCTSTGTLDMIRIPIEFSP